MLYALGLRKLSKLVVTPHGPNLRAPNYHQPGRRCKCLAAGQERVSMTRVVYLFFAGLLLFRAAKPTRARQTFLGTLFCWCSFWASPRGRGRARGA